MEISAPAANPSDDALLLRRYVREGSGEAFRQLAERCLPLVWSTARRVVNGDAALAEDIAQTVLADFAVKAAKLPAGTVPAAWLHRHTVFTASKAVRSEVRRRRREGRAAALHTPPDSSLMPPSEPSPEPWVPQIDRALDRLPDVDRRAVLLRFYERRPLREIGRILGMSEEAARKRIDRALEKLRTRLKPRGAVPAAALLMTLLREESAAMPPAAAAHRILRRAWEHAGESPSLLSGAAAVQGRARRRVPAIAAVMTAGGIAFLWWLSSSDSLDDPASGAFRAHAALVREPRPAGPLAMPDVTVTVTLMTLPEEEAGFRMLRFTAGRDDEALYRELLPVAERLQKSFPVNEEMATTGHPLVVLSGKVHTANLRAEQPEREIPPEPSADPFAAAAGTPFPQEKPLPVVLKNVREFSYTTEWDYPPSGAREPAGRQEQNAGSMFRAIISPPRQGGRCLVEFALEHMPAPPESEVWRYGDPDEKDAPDKGYIEYPVFYKVQYRSPPVPVAVNTPVLAGMKLLTREMLPSGAAGALRFFLFIEIRP